MIYEEALQLVARLLPKDSPEFNTLLLSAREMKRMRDRIEHLETIEIVARRYAKSVSINAPFLIEDEAMLLDIPVTEVRAERARRGTR